MYLDQVKVYGAPLNPDAATRLRGTPIYSWEASTGTGDDAKKEAKNLRSTFEQGLFLSM